MGAKVAHLAVLYFLVGKLELILAHGIPGTTPVWSSSDIVAGNMLESLAPGCKRPRK